MGTRYDELIAELRRAARPDRGVPPELDGYVEKVRGRAYTTTDEDVRARAEAGLTEDEIFEQTVSAAVAAGLERLDAALEVV